MALRFEPLSEKHIPAVLAIEQNSNPSPWSEASFRHELGNKDGEFLVAFDKSEIVGFGAYWAVVDEAHITNIAVDALCRGKGFGRQIMQEILARARDAGLTCSTLEVRAGNEPAIRLYESLGYQTVARRKRYYPGNNEDALVMWLYDLAGTSR